MNRRDRSRGAIEWGFIASVVGGFSSIVLVIAIGAGLYLTTKDRTEVTPDEAACDCPDLLDLINRLALAKAAMQSIDGLSNAQSAKDAQAGTPEMYSDELYEPGKAANQDAIDKAKTGAPPGAGKTDHKDCSPDVSDGRTNCMRASLQAHENVHQRECLAYNSRLKNYKYAKTMVDYWKEDREGYEKEAAYLDRHLKRVTKKCMRASNYPGAESKEEQQQRLAGSKRRVSQYVAGLS